MTKRMAVLPAVLVAAGLTATAGCGSGSAAGDASSTDPRVMTWKDDGVVVKAVGTKSTLNTTAGRSYLVLSGTDFHTQVGLAMATPAPMAPQTFVCGQTATDVTVTFTYSADTDGGLLDVQSCSVVVTQVGAVGGAPAVGTFEAVLNGAAGGTKAITNGSFSLPLTM